MKKYLYLLLVLLGACSYEDTPPEQALYCWKTQVQFSAEEADFVKNNRIERLYIRYCDVGLRDNAPVPIAPVDIDTLSVQGKTVIPVVYLKNEIFNSELTEGNSTYISMLAHKLGDYIEQINRYYRLRVSEVQFDCDWSLSTKQAYFSMLAFCHYTLTPSEVQRGNGRAAGGLWGADVLQYGAHQCYGG